MEKILTKKQLASKLTKFPEWEVNTGTTALSRTICVPNFLSALSLTARIAVHAEILNHHPSIELTYSKVKIKITTHDVKGLTQKDFDLADKINHLSLA